MIQLLRLQTSAADSEEISIKALTSGRGVHASLVFFLPASSCLSLYFYEGKRTKGLASSSLRTRTDTKREVLGADVLAGSLKKTKKKKPSMTTGSIFKEIRERMNEATTTNFKKEQPEALPHFSFHHF